MGVVLVFPYLIIAMTACLFCDWLRALHHQKSMNPMIIVMALILVAMIPPTLAYWQFLLGIGVGFFSSWVLWRKTEFVYIHPVVMTMVFLMVAFPGSFWVHKGVSHLIPSSWQFLSEKPLSPLEISLENRYHPLLTVVLNAHNMGLKNLLFGKVPGAIANQVLIANIFAAFLLIRKRLIDWRILLSVSISIVVVSGVMSFFSSSLLTVSLFWQLGVGGIFFIVIFLLSDSRIAPVVPKAKWVYGSLFGVLFLTLRMLIHDYIDVGLALVLILGILSPLLDKWALYQYPS
jgi:Na+-translocating ferredoxin:NAD+ oxidoreductase RnfD subunit